MSFRATLDSLYEEADDRQSEEGLNVDELNRAMQSRSNNPLMNGFRHTPANQYAFPQVMVPHTRPTGEQVLPVIPPSVLVNNQPSAYGSNYKRQKTSENADFTSTVTNLPQTKNAAPQVASVREEEVKNEAELISELKSSKPSSELLKSDSGIEPKITSQTVATDHSKKVKEKESEIHALEQVEESKIIDSKMDEISLQVQRNIYKNSTTWFQEETKQKAIKCFCGDNFSCDETKLIQCTKCKLKQHRKCLDKQEDQRPYICVFCQFLLMDMINMPVDTIMEPVKIGGVSESKCIKFEIKNKIVDLICKSNSNFKVEIRGLRLNEVLFKNAWPNFGTLALNGSDWSHNLSLPEREQSRKRKDEPFDLTACFKSRSRKSHSLTLIKKKHPPNQPKNEDKHYYVIGVFLTYNLQIPQIVEYHKIHERESFLSTYNMICEKLFPSHNEDDIGIVTDELKIPMRCPVTLGEIRVPVRGFQCTHVEVSHHLCD